MPFVYAVEGAPATPYATHATPNTEDPTLVLRQAVRGFDITSILVHGRGAGLVAITGIGYRLRRWTTAGTGGTAVTPSPRRVGTVASTTAADKVTAIHVEGGSSDEIDINSVSGVTAMLHHVSAEIAE